MSPHSHFVRQVYTYLQIWGNSHTYRPILRTPTHRLRFACNCYSGSPVVCINYITRQDRKCFCEGLALCLLICMSVLWLSIRYLILYLHCACFLSSVTLAISEQLHHLQSNGSKSFFRKIKLKFTYLKHKILKEIGCSKQQILLHIRASL